MSSSNDIEVLFDADLGDLVDMAQLVAICASAVDADHQDRLVAPPRHSVDFGTGRLVFTTGGSTTPSDSGHTTRFRDRAKTRSWPSGIDRQEPCAVS